MRWNGDLFGACLAAAASAALLSTGSNSAVRAVLGLPLVVFLPGYALLAALFPRRDDLKGIERLTLSFGLSLAITPLIVLVENFLPGGIRPGPLAISLAGIVVTCSAAAALERRRLPLEERGAAGIVAALRLARPHWTRWALIVAITLICSALVGARLGLSAPGAAEAFTEFYLLGPDGKIQNYPRQVFVGDPVKVVVGITNHEFRRVDYQVVAQAGGRTFATLGPIRLDGGQRWTSDLQFTPLGPAPREEITILLLRNGVVAPYRNLHLWLSVLPR